MSHPLRKAQNSSELFFSATRDACSPLDPFRTSQGCDSPPSRTIIWWNTGFCHEQAEQEGERTEWRDAVLVKRRRSPEQDNNGPKYKPENRDPDPGNEIIGFQEIFSRSLKRYFGRKSHHASCGGVPTGQTTPASLRRQFEEGGNA